MATMLIVSQLVEVACRPGHKGAYRLACATFCNIFWALSALTICSDEQFEFGKDVVTLVDRLVQYVIGYATITQVLFLEQSTI